MTSGRSKTYTGRREPGPRDSKRDILPATIQVTTRTFTSLPQYGEIPISLIFSHMSMVTLCSLMRVVLMTTFG